MVNPWSIRQGGNRCLWCVRWFNFGTFERRRSDASEPSATTTLPVTGVPTAASLRFRSPRDTPRPTDPVQRRRQTGQNATLKVTLTYNAPPFALLILLFVMSLLSRVRRCCAHVPFEPTLHPGDIDTLDSCLAQLTPTIRSCPSSELEAGFQPSP